MFPVSEPVDVRQDQDAKAKYQTDIAMQIAIPFVLADPYAKASVQVRSDPVKTP